MAAAKMINFNGQKLREDLKAKGISMACAAEKIGCSQSLFTSNTREGRVSPRKLHALCEILGLDEISYLVPAEPKQETTAAPEEEKEAVSARSGAAVDLDSIEKRLDGIQTALEKIVEAMQVHHPVFGKVERCILILQALTSYGACHYQNFEGKCRAEGLDEEVMAQALNITGYRVFIGDGVKQIKRK